MIELHTRVDAITAVYEGPAVDAGGWGGCRDWMQRMVLQWMKASLEFQELKLMLPTIQVIGWKGGWVDEMEWMRRCGSTRR